MLEIRIHPATLTSEERLAVIALLGGGPVTMPAASEGAVVLGGEEMKSAPFVPAVPFTADAAPLPTAPAAPLAIPPVPTNEAPQSPTPVTVSAAPAPGVEVDARGLPWDGRIHASTRAKLQDGAWRQKRNTDPAYVTQIENELRAALGAPVPAAAAPAPVATVVPPPAPTVAAAVPSVPPVTGAPVAPAAPDGGTTSASPSDFPSFLKRMTAEVTKGAFTQADVLAACQAVGVPTLPALGARPDLIPSICLQLGIM